MEMADHARENDFIPRGLCGNDSRNPLLLMQTSRGKTATLRMQQTQQHREQPLRFRQNE